MILVNKKTKISVEEKETRGVTNFPIFFNYKGIVFIILSCKLLEYFFNLKLRR